MKNHVAIGTHQKTGTVWMSNIFQDLAKRLSCNYKNIRKYSDAAKLARVKSKNFGIVFDSHSRFPDGFFEFNVMALHLVRDPRDVLISATKYHEATLDSFAVRSREKFGGKSLQKSLKELSSFEDKLLFEIDYWIESTIKDIASPIKKSNCLTLKYEDLIRDSEMFYVPRILTCLGFSVPEILVGLNSFWRNSIFGSLDSSEVSHIKDGSVSQYKKVFSPTVFKKFEDKFSEELEMLGYNEGREVKRYNCEAFFDISLNPVVEDFASYLAHQGSEAMLDLAQEAVRMFPDSTAAENELRSLEG
ncbi:sulfotransferase domain-containing protein [Spiribacter roseus]|uniref:sulfotransferase domain-containing protein n=1 Tax=Spiribacter roseus TaxID=1855875 RepID=UPI001330A5EC|nr:sulfotransferase domain-containing protein [Spiribacter roseus]